MERPHRNKIAFLAARNPEALIGALAAFCLVWFSAPAIGLSPDSISYTSAARSLVSTGRPIEFDGEWLMDFPLGYPALLSLIIFITRLDPFQFGLVLNGFLFGLLVFICLRETRRNGFPLFLRIAYGLCLLFGSALLQVYGMLWSETLFILCVALFFSACGHYQRSHGALALWGMAGATALACVTRYIGVSVLGMGLLLLFSDHALPWRKRRLHLLFYGVTGSALLLANLLFNRVNQGYLTGDRFINHTPLLEHLQRFGTTLIRWLPLPVEAPGSASPGPPMICATLFLGGSILGVIYLRRRKRSFYSWTALGILFTALYSLFILALAILTAFQPLDSRLLSPLWFPALGAAAGGIRALLARIPQISPARLATRVCVWIFVGLFLIPGLIREIQYIRDPGQVYQDNIRYDFSRYRQSPTLQFINTHPGLFHSDKAIYSNAGEVLYVLSGLQSDYLPNLDLPSEVQAFNADTPYLVWLHEVHAYPPGYLSGLEKVSCVQPLYTFPDGAIFSAH